MKRNETPTEQMTMSAPIQRAYESTCPSCGGYVDPRYHDPDCGNVLVAAIATLRAAVAALQDPAAVHVNILRGTIALTREAALHIACATDYDALKEQIATLTEQLREAREGGFKEGHWFRLLNNAGKLWAETSDEQEARSLAKKTGFRLQRLWVCDQREWRDE